MTVKIFDTDAYIKEYTSQVVRCLPAKDDHEGLYDLVLNETIFFPEEGGQTPDLGYFVLHRTPQNDVNVPADFIVEDVQIEGDEIHHFIKVNPALDVDSDSYIEKLLPGREVDGYIDFDRRYDNMQNHTGEHIFSGLVHSRFGYENVGFHLSERICTMDYSGVLTPEQVREIEDEANRIITSNREVICEYPTAEELASIEYRSKKEIDGAIRIVTIPDCDVCACCAPHVLHTGEVGLVKVLRVQNWKGGTRLTIVCGRRALVEYQKKQDIVDTLANEFSTSQEEVLTTVHSRVEELTQLRYELNVARQQLLEAKLDSIPADQTNVCLFTEGMDTNVIRRVVNTMVDIHSGYCGIFNGNDSDGYSYIIGIKDGNANDLNKLLKEKFNARGGGQPAMVQGSVSASQTEIAELFS